MDAHRFQGPGHLFLITNADTAALFNRFTREELEALDESGRFNFRVQMTEAQFRDAAHDWAVRLRDAAGKIARTHYIRTGYLGGTQVFECKECEDSSGFQSTDVAATVAHVMEEHPPPPLVKSVGKC
jgi:hypothetical protein